MTEYVSKPPIKIFIASSYELKPERDAFEIAIRRKNNLWQLENKPYLDLRIWETVSEAISPTRSQDEYNKIIKTVDIFVLLLWKVAGKYTQEEFQLAHQLFKQSRKPTIIVYQKETLEITDNLEAFLENFKSIGNEYFYSHFREQVDLISSFNNELDLYYNKLYPVGLTDNQRSRQELLHGLYKRYRARYRKKMEVELSFKLDLSLSYTTIGTSKQYVDDFYLDEFNQKRIRDFSTLFEEFETKIKRLLILGEPGSGKTVLLLELGIFLISKALEDPGYPIPILLNLATWRNNEQSFETWLESNLFFAGGETGISRAYARELVCENNLLLLLDGFDEVVEFNRATCMEKLAQYQFRTENSKERFDYPQLIISSRKDEYLSGTLDAPVRASIEILPLNPKNIVQALNERSENSSVNLLLKHITQDLELPSRLRTAFEVHMSLHLVHGYNFKNLDTKALLQTYINSEVNILMEANPNCRSYLSFLALKVSQTSRMNSIEMADIKPNFLKHSIFYYFFIGFFQAATMTIVMSWLAGGYGLLDNYIDSLIFGTLTGLAFTMMSYFSLKIKQPIHLPQSKIIKKRLIRGGIVGLTSIVYTIVVLQRGFKEELKTASDCFMYFLEFCFAGCLFELAVTFFHFLWGGISNLINEKIDTQEIQEFNIDRWQKANFKRGLKEGFAIGFIATGITLVYAVAVNGWDEYRFRNFRNVYNEKPPNVILTPNILYTLPIVVFLVSFSGLFIAVTRGLYKGFFTIKNIPKISNAYFRLYAQIKYDFFQWLIIVMIYMSIGCLIGRLSLPRLILISTCLAFLIAFFSSPLYKHLIVRALLFVSGKMPAKLARFLDETAKTGLMEKDGGQWRFRHQLIQNYFANKHLSRN